MLRAQSSKTPYGPKSKVEYADPGLQADGKARYPLDSEEHCRAAWSYINQADNAAKYSPGQLKRVKSRIKSAGKRYGITFAEGVAASGRVMASSPQQMLAVELARPGEYQLSTGRRLFTEANLKDAADFFAASGQTRIPIGFGHTDTRFDGDPAFGWVANIRMAKDAKGPVLLGDFVDMADWLAAAAPKYWPNRSIEGFANLAWTDGRTYSLALNRLALLGSTPPAMPNLRSLADLREAIAASAAACGAELISASAPAGLLAGLSPVDTPSPATPAAPPTNETPKETGMDPAKFREALGLTDDVSDDEVMEALVAAGFQPPAENGVTDQAIAASAAKTGGVYTVDSSQLEEFRASAARFDALTKKMEAQERDNTITEAIQAGKLPPARREHYVAAWNADPVGTKNLIATLAANLVPVAASGYSGDGSELDEDDLDREIQRLSGPTARRGA